MTQPATLVLTEAIALELAAMSKEPDECGAVLLFGTSLSGGTLRLLARRLMRVQDEHCDRSDDELIVRSAGWVPALSLAEELGASAMWLHTHPGGKPIPSRRDRIVDHELSGPFAVRTSSGTYASLIVSPTDVDGTFSFTGRGSNEHGAFELTRAFVVGNRFRLKTAFDVTPEDQVPDLYDRQVRAFGGDIQATLRRLRICVVGSGGTGSAVVEQLARLGVGELLLIDPDTLSLSNTTRVYGSTPELVGRPKVDILAEHVRRIAPNTSVETLADTITKQAVASRVSGYDLIFGCTDDEAGRMVLSRLSSYQLIPVIDLGVLIDSTDGGIDGIHARVTVLSPGDACLMCRHRVDPARAAAELADPAEHAALVKEGYAPELGGVEPAVVAFTTLAGALGVTELLERLSGYGIPNPPSEILARIHDRELSTNHRDPTPGHYCDPDSGKLGTGDSTPFLGQIWVR